MTLPIRSALSLLTLGVVAGVSFWAGQHQAQAQAPNHVFELRRYTATEGRLPDLEKRFRDHTMKIFERHGMKNIIYMVPIDGPEHNNTLVYILQHDSKEAAQKAWDAFRSDPEWVKARTASEANGKLTVKTESYFLAPTDYSPIK